MDQEPTGKTTSMKMTNVANAIAAYFIKRGYTWPDTNEALLWAMTELGEATDTWMRFDTKWVRNHPYTLSRDQDFADELGDALMMIMVAGMTRNVDPLASMLAKMERKLEELHEDSPTG